MKDLVIKILKEDREDKFLSSISQSIKNGSIKPPYILKLKEDFDLDNNQIEKVLKDSYNASSLRVNFVKKEFYLFNKNLRILYREDFDGIYWDEVNFKTNYYG